MWLHYGNRSSDRAIKGTSPHAASTPRDRRTIIAPARARRQNVLPLPYATFWSVFAFFISSWVTSPFLSNCRMNSFGF